MKRQISFFEIFILIVAVLASAYFVSENFESVSAQSTLTPEQQALQSGGFNSNSGDVDSAIGESNRFIDEHASTAVSGGDTSFYNSFINTPSFSQASGSNFDISNDGAYVCSKTKDNKICQPMSGINCINNCEGECIEGTLGEMSRGSVCELGTCYDESEGLCSPRSPRDKCEDDGGKFLNDAHGNVPECLLNCCVAGNQAWLSTERQCVKFAEDRGIEIGVGATFREVGSELECLGFAYEENKGACTIDVENQEKDNCKFITHNECDAMNGDFYENILCSNEALNTICTKQESTSCVEGLDEIYWFDSCENKENIYEGSSSYDKANSWNDGEIKAKEDSCSLGSSDGPIRNQGKCGNCNRLASSYCGSKIEGVQELDDDSQDFVCLDMGCYDEDNNRIREHGESWCAYNSEIGLAGESENTLELASGLVPGDKLPNLIPNGEKSVDSPGSTHFRKSCLNGKIVTESCGGYRNGICTEDRTPIAGSEREFSQASCKLNRWQECLAYNPSQSESVQIATNAGGAASKAIKAKLDATCGLDPDCFVKDVNVDKYFQFSYCAPRYPPGFDTREHPEPAEQICAQATQTCTVIYVKKVSGWKCVANCDCEDKEFGEQMGELCVSLGDCGLATNYVGDNPGSAGYSVGRKRGNVKDTLTTNVPDYLFGSLNPKDIEGKEFDYSDYVEGEYIKGFIDIKKSEEESWLDELFANLDINSEFPGALWRNRPDAVSPGINSGVAGVSKSAGSLGMGITAYSYLTKKTAVAEVAAEIAPSTSGGFGTETLTKAEIGAGGSGGTGAAEAATVKTPPGFLSKLSGALAGIAIVSFAINALGIGPGLGKGVTYGLMAVGGIIGYVVVAKGSIGAGCAALGPLCAGLIIFMALMKVFGVGDIKEKKYEFQCKPWVPPKNGDCESCGTDEMSDGSQNFPCNKYSCETLGRNCKYDSNSEGSNGGLCVSANIGDVQAPILIGTLEDVLNDGFKYSGFSENGFNIEKDGGSECLDQFESVTFGFTLDEYGRCRVSGERKTDFYEMGRFGSLSKNQSFTFSNLDFVDLGFEDLNSEEKNDITLYFACEDILENRNVERAFGVKMCVIPQDLTPPRITTFSGRNTLPFSATSQEIVFYTTEPSECKWDSEDKTFNEMANNLDCEIDPLFRIGGKFECKDDVAIESSETRIFVRCLDHPEWEGTERENERNENRQGVGISLMRSESALEIDSLIPNDEIIYSGTPIVSVNVEARTSGGVDGNADCYLNIDGRKSQFSTTGGNTHRQLLTSLGSGSHSMEVNCIDSAGNIAKRNASFSIELKSTIPKIGRVYASSGILYIVTNEKAECSYTNTGCGFSVSDGIEFDSNSAKTTHFTNFDKEKTYYAKCKDEFNNEKVGKCDIVIEEGEF